MFEGQKREQRDWAWESDWHERRLSEWAGATACRASQTTARRLEFILGTLRSCLDLGFQRSLWLPCGESITRECCSEGRERERCSDRPDQRSCWWWRDGGAYEIRLKAGSVSGHAFSKEYVLWPQIFAFCGFLFVCFVNTEFREVKLGLHTLINTQQVLAYVSGQRDIPNDEISFGSHFPRWGLCCRRR